jgi:hypothetical protein
VSNLTAGGADSNIDLTALHNLELLSSLDCADKKALNRIRLIGRWLSRNRCQLPLRGILEDYPRCYCNYNPIGGPSLQTLANQVNSAIRDGIESVRNVLRSRARIIIEELRTMNLDDGQAKMIAALLSRGPMVPLKPGAVEALNGIVRRRVADFTPGC